MEDSNTHVREAVEALTGLVKLNTVRVVDKIAEVFESPLLRDEFFTGAMVGAVVRDCIAHMREAPRATTHSEDH